MPVNTHLPTVVVVRLSLNAAWAQAWSDRGFRREFLITVPLLGAALALLSSFLEFAEDRPGVVLSDALLQHLAPVNLTWFTFAVIYLALAAGLTSLAHHPRMLLVTMQSYVAVVAVRILMMSLVPLEPAAGLIPLADPLVQAFGSGRVPTKDLFFSGHTSTLFLLFLTAPDRRLKMVFLLCTLAVGTAVLWQHVHYTIDVLVAPFVTYACYRVVVTWQELRHAPSRSSR